MTTISPVPVQKRSMFFGGLWLLLGRPWAVVWAYLFQLVIALVFSLRLHAQLSALLDHSAAAQGLNGAFDLGTLINATTRIGWHVPSAGASGFAGIPIWLAVYFLLVPGALLAYRVKARARLGFLLHAGVDFFWRFVRITLLTGIVCGVVLGLLFALQGAWANYVEERMVGAQVYWYELPLLLVIGLVAALLRLYFDLVEAYTVQLDAQYRPSGKPDRRVRRALIPAAKTLARNWFRALLTFVVLTLAGAAALFFAGRFALHSLAQPRVWPTFLVVQAALLLHLAMRFWQRAAETVLVADNPIAWVPALHAGTVIEPGVGGFVYPPVANAPGVLPPPGYSAMDSGPRFPATTPIATVPTPPVYHPISQPVHHPVMPVIPVIPTAVAPAGTVADPIPDPEPPVPPLRKHDSGIFQVPPRNEQEP